MNRIYIRHEDIAESLYRRRKETRFTTEDVMRLHWDRQGRRALSWARKTIHRLLKRGWIVASPRNTEGDKRRCTYRFNPTVLRELRLYDPAAWEGIDVGSQD